MEYENKSKEDLIKEIRFLRSQLEHVLERDATPSSPNTVQEKNVVERDERAGLEGQIKFSADFDLKEAIANNYSSTGISITTDEELSFKVYFEIDEDLYSGKADLMWLKRTPEQGIDMGFRFLDVESSEGDQPEN